MILPCPRASDRLSALSNTTHAMEGCVRFPRYTIVVITLLLAIICTGCADILQSTMYSIFPVGSSQEQGISARKREERATEEQNAISNAQSDSGR
jgi:hypothetical protein